MPPPKALLAWDIGTGRGHIVHLRAVAEQLKLRGIACAARLGSLTHAADLADLCDGVTGTPRRPTFLEFGAPMSSHYGDWLGGWRFGDSARLRQWIEAWRDSIAAAKPDIVVADNAPVAILAARSLAIPVVAIGVPVLAPPADLNSYPAILAGDRDPQFDETWLCRAVCRAGGPLGLPEADRLPHVFSCADQVVASLPLLDCYGAVRRSRLVPPVIGPWTEPGERRRDEVFVYLSTFDELDAATLAGLAAVNLPIRVFAIGSAEWLRRIPRRDNLTIETNPVPPGEIARRARLLVHRGQHGITCLGLRAGLPQVAIGLTHEHVFDGRQLAAAGLGIAIERNERTTRNVATAIARLWEDGAVAARATAYADEIAAAFAGNPGALTAERIAAVLS